MSIIGSRGVFEVNGHILHICAPNPVPPMVKYVHTRNDNTYNFPFTESNVATVVECLSAYFYTFNQLGVGSTSIVGIDFGVL